MLELEVLAAAVAEGREEELLLFLILFFAEDATSLDWLRCP